MKKMMLVKNINIASENEGILAKMSFDRTSRMT